MTEIKLLSAEELNEGEIGKAEFSTTSNKILTITNNNKTIEWQHDKHLKQKFHWQTIETSLKLHSGIYSIDFQIEKMSHKKIGIGFLLLWNKGVDWGFYGFLGSSSSSFSYDPSVGEIISQSRPIKDNLPKFEGDSGEISIEFHLPRKGENCSASFRVNGVRTPPITLPHSSVVVPAVCLLNPNQKISISSFRSTID